VAVIPGATFGSTDGTYFRIAYGAMTPQTAGEGITRFVRGITEIVRN
jgi:aspartate/methionine/tyrosine aminotransferase